MAIIALRLVLSVAMTAGVVTLLLWWHAWLWRRASLHEDECRYPGSRRFVAATIGGVGTFFGGVWLVGGAFDDGYPGVVALVVCGALVCLAAWLIVTTANWRLWASDQGIQLRDRLGRVRPTVPWDKIRRFRPAGRFRPHVFELTPRGRIGFGWDTVTHAWFHRSDVMVKGDPIALAEKHGVPGAGVHMELNRARWRRWAEAVGELEATPPRSDEAAG
jgi:hypothetical protein